MKKKAKKDNSLFAYYGFTKRDAKKYPVISGILKQLTPERIKKEIEEIQKVELPPASAKNRRPAGRRAKRKREISMGKN